MYFVPLNFIEPNPWQPRAPIKDIDELAESIRMYRERKPDTLGLLQVPAGRIVEADGGVVVPLRKLPSATNLGDWLLAQQCQVQLVYGHRRLAAFRELGYECMPVEIGVWGSEDMATMAWSENAQRRDLSPLEQATLIQRMLIDFQWTQEQVAEKIKLDRSTVANKVRLLKLPEVVRQAIQEGSMSERQGMAVLPLYELPETLLKVAERGGLPSLQPSAILRDAQAGHSSDSLRGRVDQLVGYFTRQFDPQGWPLSMSFDQEGVRSKECVSCNARIRAERCGDKNCFDIKQAAWWKIRHENEKKAEPEPQPDQETISHPETQPAEPQNMAPLSPLPLPVPEREPDYDALPEKKDEPGETESPEETPVQPAPVQAPAVKPAPPAPTVQAAPPPDWNHSLVAITVTLFPQNGNGDRLVSIGARANQDAPTLKTYLFSEIGRTGSLADMLADVRRQYELANGMESVQ